MTDDSALPPNMYREGLTDEDFADIVMMGLVASSLGDSAMTTLCLRALDERVTAPQRDMARIMLQAGMAHLKALNAAEITLY